MLVTSEQGDIGLVQRIKAATLGSCLVAFSVTPLEVIKVRMQTSDRAGVKVGTSSASSSSTPPAMLGGNQGAPAAVPGSSYSAAQNASRHQGFAKMLSSRLVNLSDGIGDHLVRVPSRGLNRLNGNGGAAAAQAGGPGGSAAGGSTAATSLVSGSTAGGGGGVATSTSSSTSTTSAPGAAVRPRGHLLASSGGTNTILGTLRRVIRAEGVAALYRPMWPALLMSVPGNVLYFVAFDSGHEALQKVRSRHDLQIPFPSAAFAGVVARTLTVVCMAPFEIVRTRLGTAQNKNVFDTACDLYRSGGLSSYWRGLRPTLLRDVPFSAVYWGCYDFCTRNWKKDFENAPWLFSFGAGFLSGAAASVISHPFDVLKTQRQVQEQVGGGGTRGSPLPADGASASSARGSIWSSNHASPAHSRSTLSALRELQQQKLLFAGLAPRILRAAPACAIMISSYEYVKTNL